MNPTTNTQDTPTPRTDAEALRFGRIMVTCDLETVKTTRIVPYDFARQLERELAAKDAELAKKEA